MIKEETEVHNTFLDQISETADVSMCRRVIARFLTEYEIDPDCAEYELLEATVIDCFRLGARDDKRLRNLVRPNWEAVLEAQRRQESLHSKATFLGSRNW